MTQSQSPVPRRAPALECVSVGKSFGPLVALEGVSIKVAPGSFHALLAENIALRSFDRPPVAGRFGLVSPARMRAQAKDLIARFRIRNPSPDAPIATLSGGNIQRAVLARELSGKVGVLIVQNPCFGLDFASVAEIRNRIVEARNKGAAVLLASDDLDEIFELSDRIAVMSGGRITHVTPAERTSRAEIGPHMAGGHWRRVPPPQCRWNSPRRLRHSAGPISLRWVKRTECSGPSILPCQNSMKRKSSG